MSENTVTMRIGGVSFEVPKECAGSSSRDRCPDLDEMVQAGATAVNFELRQAIGNTAAELGEKAASSCGGCIFKDSDSGITWAKRCPLTNRIERSN